MTTAPLASVPAAAAKRLSRGAAIMALGGIGLVGYGLLFLVQNFTGFLELGISRAEVDVGRADIQRFSPSLYHYISHLHIALAGFIAACGVAVAVLAWFGVRRGELWAWVTAVVVPVLALAVALPAHYPWHLDTVGHLGLIYADTVLFCVGAALALAGLQRIRGPA
jgi:cytochrome bd-type quinol oxidase subunit 2